MGKKGAYSGMSPKDVSILAMDRFIQRNDRKRSGKKPLPARRKDVNIPIHMWPLKDQIEYWENRSDEDRFLDQYPSYGLWLKKVKELSGVYPETFLDFTSNIRMEIRSLYDSYTTPKMAVLELRKYGVY
jgi:hypothetical protein